MAVSPQPLRQPARMRRPAPQAPRASTTGRKAAAPRKNWHKERRRGAVALVTATILFGILLGAFGIHAQMAQAAARAAARDVQIALETGASLNRAVVLFVPEYGNVCRRRWIDNATWTLRDGGEVGCEEEAAWNSAVPPREHNVERRIDAIRNVFQQRALGRME